MSKYQEPRDSKNSPRKTPYTRRPRDASPSKGDEQQKDTDRSKLHVRNPERWSPREKETDPHKIHQRQKQVDFGKNTIGYVEYLKAVPKEQRTKEHPRTPDVTRKCGKRAFDGLITKWRRELHKYDPSVPAEDQPDDIADLGEYGVEDPMLWGDNEAE